MGMKISFDLMFDDVDELFNFVDWCRTNWGQPADLNNSSVDYSESNKLWGLESIIGKGLSYRIWVEEIIELTEFKLKWL